MKRSWFKRLGSPEYGWADEKPRKTKMRKRWKRIYTHVARRRAMKEAIPWG